MAKLNVQFANKALEYIGQGATKFRKWYYNTDLKGTPWCAVFVSYVANESGILNKIVKRCQGAGDFAREGTASGRGKWYEGDVTKPQVGDIVTFTWNGKGKYEGRDAYFSDHVGIVYKVDRNYVYTVEGNTNGTNDTSIVSKRIYALYDGNINGYYRPNWSAIKTSQPKKDTVNKVAIPDVTYRVRVGGKWLSVVKNFNNYAGVRGKAITDVAIKVGKGTVKYRVHIKGGRWLPYVTGYNINNSNNGYAGNGKPIDAIEVYYSTPSDIVKSRGYLVAKYHVAPINGGYYDYQYDNEKTNGQDGYAGCFGKAIDKFQLILVED